MRIAQRLLHLLSVIHYSVAALYYDLPPRMPEQSLSPQHHLLQHNYMPCRCREVSTGRSMVCIIHLSTSFHGRLAQALGDDVWQEFYKNRFGPQVCAQAPCWQGRELGRMRMLLLSHQGDLCVENTTVPCSIMSACVCGMQQSGP